MLYRYCPNSKHSPPVALNYAPLSRLATPRVAIEANIAALLASFDSAPPQLDHVTGLHCRAHISSSSDYTASSPGKGDTSFTSSIKGTKTTSVSAASTAADVERLLQRCRIAQTKRLATNDHSLNTHSVTQSAGEVFK